MEYTDIPLDDAAAIRQLVVTRQVSPLEVVRCAVQRASEVDSRLNIFVTMTEQQAIEDAKALERAILRKEPVGALAGVPITVKDNLNVAGVVTTHGSHIMRNNVASDDSPAVARARAAGALIIGKTTLSEFATQVVGESPLTGSTRNPWDPDMTSGGSSAGGAVGVAAGVTPLALVTDGGGSARIPASFCGVFGIKPQLGRVPYVPIGATPTLSHVGVISNNVTDAAKMLQIISGGDARDPLAIPEQLRPLTLGKDIAGLRVAWSPHLGDSTPTDEVLRVVKQAVEALDQLGAVVEEVDGLFADPFSIFQSEFFAGAGARLAPLLSEQRDVMDPVLVDQLLSGQDQTLHDYFSSVAERNGFREKVYRVFQDFDVVVTPTAPVPAFEAGRYSPPAPAGEHWAGFTYPWNLTGNPAANVPCGFTTAGLPIGMQVVGRAFDEATVLHVAHAYEALRPWQHRRPAVG